MTPAGRTSWWPCDAAEHDRELNVELGEEFGAAGPYLMRVLKDLAQQQRDGGRVRTGFRVLRTKTFIDDTATTRRIVERAAAIGAVDDLRVDDDGRRFICRVSGWEADQARGREAIKKASQRRDTSPPEGTKDNVVPFERDEEGQTVGFVPISGDGVPECPPTREEITRDIEPPLPPKGGARQRDKAQFDEAVREYATALGIEHEDGWQNVKAAIGQGAKTTDDVVAWVRKWRPDVLPEELAA